MKKSILLFASFLLIALSCKNEETEAISTNEEGKAQEASHVYSPVKHPEWSSNSSIYEVNIRQFTEEGTFTAFSKHLPRLQKLGVEILWIMPIQPIGEEKRKGGLGSYYSIKDYKAVNPEFGSIEEFKNLVKQAHEMGFKIILDWVANHSAWDNVWMNENPEWYSTDSMGNIVAPVADWSDVADLNYESKEMRAAMLEAMEFWVKETDIDGYRCDVGMMVPMDFWNDSREKLDKIKPVFMLAEAEGEDFHKHAFDMTYGWEFHHLMNQVAKGIDRVDVFDSYQEKMDSTYSKDDYRMFFTTNHDENSWNGTVKERMGDNHLNFFVLACTFPNGMPLIYSGQEAGLNKRLAFFEKDKISWSDTSLYPFYREMIELKTNHPALVNGKNQGSFERVESIKQEGVYAYRRKAQNSDEEILVVLNFGDEDLVLKNEDMLGNWDIVMKSKSLRMNMKGKFIVKAHDFLLFK
tara:strand:- start:50827 stop:52221 length:1395 start_codon:yes stop_codon:yes gene_type:complete